MPFQLIRVNCVVVGTFNQYIVQPQWLAQEEIIPKGTELELKIGLNAPGSQFVIPALQTQWSINPTKLIIESKDPKVDCGETMAKVLEKLPYTPIQGVGNNFIFESEASVLDGIRDFGEYPSLDLPKAYGIRDMGYHFSLERGDYMYNFSLTRQEEKAVLSVNVHAELDGKPNEFGREAAGNFKKHRETSRRLIKRIFKAGGGK